MSGSFNPASRGVPMGNGWTWFAAAWSTTMEKRHQPRRKSSRRSRPELPFR